MADAGDQTLQEENEIQLLDMPVCIQAELIARVLIKAQQSLDKAAQQQLLANFELACKQTRSLVVEQQLWRVACVNACPTFGSTVHDIDCRVIQADSLSSLLGKEWRYRDGLSDPERCSLIHKNLFTKTLAVTHPDTLIAKVLHTSSTGGGSDPASMLEKYDHSYDRIMHLVGRPHHWRGAPTAHQGGADDVIFQLQFPVCLVRGVKLRVPKEHASIFKVPTGRHRPMKVRFHMGYQPEGESHSSDQTVGAGTTELDSSSSQWTQLCLEQLKSGRGTWLHSTEVFDFDQSGECSQHFNFPQVLCSGGLLKVELIGKGGPPSEEHDVRIVFAKVMGVDIRGADVEGRTLVSRSAKYMWYSGGPAGVYPPTPRFDSSDSEAGEDELPEFWHA